MPAYYTTYSTLSKALSAMAFASSLILFAPQAAARLYISPDGWSSPVHPPSSDVLQEAPDGGSVASLQTQAKSPDRPLDRSRVHILSTGRSVAESIEAWALEEGWRIRWDAAMPPIRPRRTTRYFGSVDHPDGALAMVLDRISPIIDLSAEVHPEDRVISIQPWRKPKWLSQEFRLVDSDSDLTLDF